MSDTIKTYDELLTDAEKIRTNELPNSNSANLVGGHLKELINRTSSDSYFLFNSVYTNFNIKLLSNLFIYHDGTLGSASGYYSSSLFQVSQGDIIIRKDGVVGAPAASGKSIFLYDSNKSLIGSYSDSVVKVTTDGYAACCVNQNTYSSDAFSVRKLINNLVSDNKINIDILINKTSDIDWIDTNLFITDFSETGTINTNGSDWEISGYGRTGYIEIDRICKN
jgi:hypothetical protein